MSWKDNAGIIIILLLFICANLMILNFYSDVWWDSAVYIGMGKHIWSAGRAGLWEETRPLIFPLILGIGWISNFNVVYFGRFISIIFSILAIFVIYKIGIKLFSKKVGLMAAFFTAFSYNFLFFSPNILTEIPSTLFVLLAFYSFLDNRYFLMGLFSGIAIMSRLYQIFTLIGLWAVFFAYFSKKPVFFKKLFYSLAGILILILPYVLLNHYLYNDMLHPLKFQIQLTKITGWMHHRGAWFYFAGLLKENFFIIFLLSLPLFLKKNHKFFALLLTPLIYILIFIFIKQKEMRFILVVLPFLYLLIAYCLEQIYKKIRYKKLALAMFCIAIVIWLAITFASIRNMVLSNHQENDEGFLYFQSFLKNSKGKVWITNPLYALYSDSKIDGLLYYSPEKLINFINENKDSVNFVLFSSCDILCPPAEIDPLCAKSREILDRTLSKFERIYQKEINACKYEIYKRPIS